MASIVSVRSLVGSHGLVRWLVDRWLVGSFVRWLGLVRSFVGSFIRWFGRLFGLSFVWSVGERGTANDEGRTTSNVRRTPYDLLRTAYGGRRAA